jgi:hypothetical protein
MHFPPCEIKDLTQAGRFLVRFFQAKNEQSKIMVLDVYDYPTGSYLEN